MVNAEQIPIAIFTFIAIVAALPAWVWFSTEFGSNLEPQTRFLSQLVLPMLVLFFIASHIGGT